MILAIIANIESANLDKYTLKNGEKIPTLSEVLDVCRNKICLNIEIKEDTTHVSCPEICTGGDSAMFIGILLNCLENTRADNT